ncbi:hypothetical protein [Crassaminicella profunda]|uniref:hypothetical protein n=1 Tax=Crassaminicella profunda TaxID=1286698 RepID=UPI001CA75F63|nr:hypothetical protein [Crassaminicella profunda]QZY54963.1 hypothetical protein K7H06_18400 [Crassaminicella profunda]
MNNSDQLNRLLKQALSSTVEPSEELNEKIINQLKEKDILKPVYKKSISVALIVAIITIAMSITVLAAWYFLSPKQVAEHLKNETLAQAFEQKNAIKINESIISGGYNFNLLGIVSGENLSDFRASIEDIHSDRTYAVVSIVKQDGSKMPDIDDEEYGKNPFFISPLIKGQKPWQVNIASMNGGYNDCVIEGVMYRLIECDGVEMFADRGLYLCISNTDSYSINAFNYNEQTGEISPNVDYKGANALFKLPLDIKKADHEKAEKYLAELLKEPKEDSTDIKESFTDSKERLIDIDWEKEIEKGVVIPESVKKVTHAQDGLVDYEYEHANGKRKIGFRPDNFFKEGEIGVYKTRNIYDQTAIQFLRDTDGVITGRAVKLEKKHVSPIFLSFVDWKKAVADGIEIPKSIKEVTCDVNGLARYEYEGYSFEIPIDDYFKEGEIGVYKTVSMQDQMAIQISRDAEGGIIARALKLEPNWLGNLQRERSRELSKKNK